MSMTKTQEARFRDLAGVVQRCREGGAFAEIEEQYAAADRWTTSERDVVRDCWSVVESVLGDEAPRRPDGAPEFTDGRTDPTWMHWRAALTILALLGDGPQEVDYDPALGRIVYQSGVWHGAGPGYFLESIVCGELPKEARDVFKRFSSHLAWEPKTPKERVVAARRRAAVLRKALRIERHA